jgi:(1->4)-alpha-D-glucan 1-alpha-D-glucosylmutase
MRIPVATYRLQINDDFTLHDAHAIVPYLADLGASDIYLSPVFEARPGSTHGYDVTDPTRVRESIGGMAALRALGDEARRHGMGILLDIVPNHMAASPLNPWWHDVLENGSRSPHARFFDIDWGPPDAPRPLRLPILADHLDAVIERGEIRIDPVAAVVVYHETRLPLAPGSMAGDGPLPGGELRSEAVRRILARQHYELAFWRTASEEMNYRRFFDITDLAGVRVEDEHVFQATHSLIHALAADGVITGLRIDHIDGLRDPAGYLQRLRRLVRGLAGEPVYTVVEKILAHAEHIPADWQCEGTTGYEFLNLATGLLIHPDGYDRLDRFYTSITGDSKPFGELVREKKQLVLRRLFQSELSALARRLSRLTSLAAGEAERAVAEVTASMGVYRTYIRDGTVRDQDRRRIDAALADATARNPDLAGALAALRDLLLRDSADLEDAALDWILRWQQFTGPVMAKGFEDTAPYCHNALLAANEVGSDPAHSALTARALLAALERRRAHSPSSLNATATHDTKRGEDTRARIAVLSEVPDEWQSQLRRWRRSGDSWKAEIIEDEDAAMPQADVDSLLYQTLIGAWPMHGPDDVFVDRIKTYMTKAVREAKEQTSWRRPDEDFEQAVSTLIDMLMQEFGRVGLAESIGEFARRLAPHGALNSLAQLLLKIAAPGIPDIYQGTELWSFTLVDPDNRQPVDYDERRRALHEVAHLLDDPDAREVRTRLEQWHDGRIKLLVTALALQCRTRHADVFSRGALIALHADGARADHVLAFAHALDADACMLVLPRWTARVAPAGLMTAGAHLWEDTRIPVPETLRGAWRNALTGERLEAGEQIAIAAVFASIPFAFLERP